MKKLASALDPLWYKDAVIYEIHVRAFADSNNDGIGDFPGLMSRLDYLQELGVTCLWLLPFFPSPLRDDGYDIANYVDVNPSYGTLADFKAFLDAAHQRGMQVMIELVINHTSDQHPWFKAARQAPPGSPERNMYVWSDTDQRFKDARIIFTDTEKSNWTWDDVAKSYYWHRFFSHQPDLNFDNPLVMEEVLKAMRFWLDMGVDALRLDAIPYLVERDGTNCENLAETHVMIKQIRAAIDEGYANRLILAEANQWPADVRPYFGDGDECHMAFHFPLMPRIYMALRQEDRLPITDIMAQTPPIPDNCQWGLFLRNHDELTLEMVTDDERDYMYFAYSADPRMRVNVGIRRRLAPLVDNNRRRIELLNSILFSFPGTPIIYYGDEIGMGDNIYLGDRNGVRTPMQWTGDRNAGFSKCDPARLYFPVIMDPIYGYQVVNVEAQLSDQSSLLHWTRNMIALRKLFQVFGRGTLTFLNPANRKVLAYIRDLDLGDGTHETILCVANLSRFAQPVSLDLSQYVGMEPVEMIGYVQFPTVTSEPYALSLAPYSFLWLELQPAASKIDSLPELLSESPQEMAAHEPAALDILTKGWAGFIAGHGLPLLETAIPAWLPRQRWFGAKTRKIVNVKVLDWAELPAAIAANTELLPVGDLPADSSIPPALFYVEVNYGEGSCDVYQVPLAFSTGSAAEQTAAERPLSVVTTMATPVGQGILHDATVREDFRQLLLSLIERNGSLDLSTLHSAAIEVAASLAAASTGHSAREAAATGEADELLAHPDRATHNPPGPGMVHLRPHEVFPEPANPAVAPPSPHPQHDGDNITPHPLAGVPVEPLPITTQPGEAATPPRSDSTTSPSGHTQRHQPRESPSAGNFKPRAGFLHAQASRAFESARGDQHLPARVGSAEQSNTSILYGKQIILKLFRRLQAGENPDVEIGRFLTEATHFQHIAPFLGEINIIPSAGEKTTVAMMQGLVENEGDGWQWFLDQFSDFFSRVISIPAPTSAPAQFTANTEPAAELSENTGATLEAAALLGRRTAEMHLALATPADDSAFIAEPFTPEDLNRDALRIEEQIRSASDALKGKLASLPEDIADDAAQLLSRRRELLSRARSIFTGEAAGQKFRIHGDYHLGQTLRTAPNASQPGGDFVMLDFEGEPARPLAERRRKQSPLKDVAGMVRSFSYAAFSALDRFRSAHPDRDGAAENLMQWSRAWESAAVAAFLQAYRKTMATRPELLPPEGRAQDLLRAYLLEKGMYEVLYELDNRPAWLRIPLTGILHL
ncbi:maltose alpha-D-glucosyltransferase [Occallatibacter riparius]|uniref:Maltokinase n=1 Tax=Occallatibacter riparius TaxID=1002689 RepID=A0A9J7BT68_9BACT|nr:maltose alpha-D-glucosyltransferase [Occallatibacter riparius]UWZ85785.1 maltose alpha-D-glucosyltransferase [Occallatibacter riparius]